VGEDRDEGKNSLSTPTSILPHQGGGELLLFSSFEVEVAVMKHCVENKTVENLTYLVISSKEGIRAFSFLFSK